MKFPLFVLPSSNWIVTDKVVFLDGKVVDERNLPGKTLGIRRLQSGRKDLLPLKRAVMDIPQLLNCNKKYFIDSVGNLITYEKTYSSKLVCYRIKRIEKKDVASLLILEGVPSPITVKRLPMLVDRCPWARVLHVRGAPWILYDFVGTKRKDTYRRI